MTRKGARMGDAGIDGSSSAGAFIVAARRATSLVERVVKPEGLTVDQWLTLEALADAGPLTMSDLASRTMVTGPTLTRVIDRLVATALAYREVDAYDRRRVLVHLSTRGRSAYQRVSAGLTDIEDDVLAQLAEVTTTLVRRGRIDHGSSSGDLTVHTH